MIPKFSIRQMLILMVAVGVIATFMAGAYRENRIAFGLSVAIFGNILLFVVLAVVHWFAFGVATIWALKNPDNDNQLSYSTTGSPIENDQAGGSVGAEIVTAEAADENLIETKTVEVRAIETDSVETDSVETTTFEADSGSQQAGKDDV
jgi:hypothetical protein